MVAGLSRLSVFIVDEICSASFGQMTLDVSLSILQNQYTQLEVDT